jgi:glycosyltransferase involved in cell wall biosynthesis
LIFVGNLSYQPNHDGLLWFLGDVWPGLRDVVPGVSLMVAGSNPDQQLRRLCQQDGVELIVNPQDLMPLYRLADAAIVPLRFGSGSRIKILEAGAHGVPVISTFAGAEGLNLHPDAHAFLSDETAGAFVNSCLECLRIRDEAHRRSTLFQAFIEERHDRQEIINRLHKTLRTLVAG